jgi:hypothetical protein
LRGISEGCAYQMIAGADNPLTRRRRTTLRLPRILDADRAPPRKVLRVCERELR